MKTQSSKSVRSTLAILLLSGMLMDGVALQAMPVVQAEESVERQTQEGEETPAVQKQITVAKVTKLQTSGMQSTKTKVTYKAVKGAAGYQIVYARNSKFTKSKKSVYTNKTSRTLTKLKKKSAYYVKVRAYIVDTAGNKVFGAYSKTVKADVADAIVKAAYKQIGVRYVYGGTSRKGFDCSGLTRYCHKQAGISIARTSGAQRRSGKTVSKPKPGDIVSYTGHVGIYIGKGKMIHAPKPGQKVKIVKVYGNPKFKRYW